MGIIWHRFDTPMTDNTMTDNTTTDNTAADNTLTHTDVKSTTDNILTHTDVKSATDEPHVGNSPNEESDINESDIDSESDTDSKSDTEETEVYVEEKKIDAVSNLLNNYPLPDLTKYVLEYSRIQPEITYSTCMEVVIRYRDPTYTVADDFNEVDYMSSDFYKHIDAFYGTTYAKNLFYRKTPIMKDIYVKIRDVGPGAYRAIVSYGKNPNALYKVSVEKSVEWHDIKGDCRVWINLKGQKHPYPVPWDVDVTNLLIHTTDAQYDLTTYEGLMGYIRHYRRMQKLIRPTHITSITFS